MVLIIQQILPKYRYEVLKYLDKNEFKILYSDVVKESSLRSYKSDAENIIEIPIFRIGEKYIQNILPALIKFKPDKIIFTPELRNFTFWVLFLLRFYMGFKLIAWTHGINNRDFFSEKLSFQTKLRILIVRFSDEVIVYSKDRAEKLKSFVNVPVRVASNTLDTKVLDKVFDQLEKAGIKQVKRELQVQSDLNFIYVGRLIKEKNIIRNIDLFHQIHKKSDNSAFRIIGDGPESENLKNYVSEKQINGVSFMGSITDQEELGKWLYISDLHLHLGYVGLAVVHSMCFRTPMVTLIPEKERGPFHSPEFSYLDKENSIIDSPEIIFSKVTGVLDDEKKLENMKIKSRSDYLNECRLEQFMKPFLEIVQ